MDILKLQKFLEENNEPKYRLAQIKKAVYQDGILEFDKILVIPKSLREKLAGGFKILSFDVEKVFEKKDVYKALLKIIGGEYIETVLIANEKGWTICVSSQCGCSLGCKFCATGDMGFKKDLSSEEICDQVLFWKGYIRGFLNNDVKANFKRKSKLKGFLPRGKRGVEMTEIKSLLAKRGNITNIVYMGMGEPFLNWVNVRESLNNLMGKDTFGFGARAISISTVGIPERIKEFAKEFGQVNLGISLHSADDKKRSSLIPINKKYNLSEIKKAIDEYFKISNRKFFIEYLMIKNVTDTKEDIKKLLKYINSFEKKKLLHINLIPYNGTSKKFSSSSDERIRAVAEILLKNNIRPTVRRSLGSDIGAACGELGGK